MSRPPGTFQALPQFRAVPGQTGIVVHAWKLPIAFGIGVKLTVDGYQIPNTTWGPNYVSVPPGQHMVTVDATQWGMGYGGAFSPVQVFPGHTTEVHYTAPAQLYMKGIIAPERRSAPGVAISYAAMLFLFVIVMAAVALAFV